LQIIQAESILWLLFFKNSVVKFRLKLLFIFFNFFNETSFLNILPMLFNHDLKLILSIFFLMICFPLILFWMINHFHKI